jgi:hypothetical protein
VSNALAAEGLVAATGILDVLKGTPQPVLKSTLEAADAIPGQIRHAMAEFCREPGFSGGKRPRVEFSYEKALERLTRQLTQDDLEAIAEGFRPELQPLATEYAVVVQRIWAYLRSKLPIRTRRNMTEEKNVTPSDRELQAFRRAYEIAESPILIVSDFLAGRLTRDQVAAVQAMYPELYQLMRDTFFFALRDRKAAKLSWELPRPKDLQTQVFMRASADNPGLVREVQETLSKPPPKPAPLPQVKSGNASELQTQTDKIANG